MDIRISLSLDPWRRTQYRGCRLNSCYKSHRPQDHHHLGSCYTTESFISELNNKGNDITHSTRCQPRTTGRNDKTLCGSKLHSLVSSRLFGDARALPKDCTLGSRGPKSRCVRCSYILRAERCSSGVGGHAEFSVKLLLVVILFRDLNTTHLHSLEYAKSWRQLWIIQIWHIFAALNSSHSHSHSLILKPRLDT